MFNDTQKKEKKQEHLLNPTAKKKKIPIFVEYMEDKKLKIDRLKECGNFLSFISNKDRTNFRLVSGNFCKNRFCPICSWLKARKNAFEILELLKVLEKKENKRFVFITLTIPNVSGSVLKNTITEMNKSFERLFKTEDVKIINHGYIRKLEVTYNQDRNDYHPHFHAIVAVNSSYFTSRDYLKKRRLLELWQKAARDYSITQVDIKPVRMGSIKEVMEIATYSAKQGELYLNKKVFDGFYNGLYRKKLITFNGLFKEYRKLQEKGKLEFEDEELENLKEKASIELGYNWNLQEYKEIFERLLSETDERTLYKIKIDID